MYFALGVFEHLEVKRVIGSQMLALQLVAKKVILDKVDVNKKSYIRITDNLGSSFLNCNKFIMGGIKRG